MYIDPPYALPPRRHLAPVPIPSVRHLRNCFRTSVIGDVRTGTFQTFWAAVGRRSQGVEVTLDKPTSSRNSAELRVAFALVRAGTAGRAAAASASRVVGGRFRVLLQLSVWRVAGHGRKGLLDGRRRVICVSRLWP